MRGLSAENVSLCIDGKNILRDINLELPEGSVLGVLGPNGAGKTSLLKILAGQLEGKGKIQWNGEALLNLNARDRAQKVAVVNQLNDSVFALTLEQIVSMGRLPHQSLLAYPRSSEHRGIIKAIEALGLGGKTTQKFSSLSGGEQQRVLIARALVQQASLLILDEPINHLDIFYQHEILQLLKQLSTQLGKTIVMSLHDVNLSARYCDQLCLLNEGQVIAMGDANHVLDTRLLKEVFGLDSERLADASAAGFRIEFKPNSKREYDFKEWQ